MLYEYGIGTKWLAPWRDMTRPTLDEMYYDFNEGATNPQPAFSASLGFDTIMQLNQKLGMPNEPSE